MKFCQSNAIKHSISKELKNSVERSATKWSEMPNKIKSDVWFQKISTTHPWRITENSKGREVKGMYELKLELQEGKGFTPSMGEVRLFFGTSDY